MGAGAAVGARRVQGATGAIPPRCPCGSQGGREQERSERGQAQTEEPAPAAGDWGVLVGVQG